MINSNRMFNLIPSQSCLYYLLHRIVSIIWSARFGGTFRKRVNPSASVALSSFEFFSLFSSRSSLNTLSRSSQCIYSSIAFAYFSITSSKRYSLPYLTWNIFFFLINPQNSCFIIRKLVSECTTS